MLKCVRDVGFAFNKKWGGDEHVVCQVLRQSLFRAMFGHREFLVVQNSELHALCLP
jgi:hypothetical protein